MSSQVHRDPAKIDGRDDSLSPVVAANPCGRFPSGGFAVSMRWMALRFRDHRPDDRTIARSGLESLYDPPPAVILPPLNWKCV